MLHQLLDTNYGPDGDAVLQQHLAKGANTEKRENGETLLHVAVRRRRLNATAILLEHGADINAQDAHGKTAYAHAIRRRFTEICELLMAKGTDTTLNTADQFAVAVINDHYEEARQILQEDPSCVRTGNPEEDRLLADVAGRSATEPVEMLIAAGADLTAPALDDGTPLHQAAWFGQPANARLLIDAGAPLDIFDSVHHSSPLHWAVHGARYSGGADERQEAYIELVKMLLAAGSSLHYPEDPEGDAYLLRLRKDATPGVLAVLPVSL